MIHLAPSGTNVTPNQNKNRNKIIVHLQIFVSPPQNIVNSC